MVQMHLSYGESTSFEMMMGFEMASAWWSEVLTDDVDVYFHVDGTSDLPQHIVGGALPAVSSSEKYEDIRDSLIEDVTSDTDQLAVNHLHAEKKFSVTANGDSDLSKTEKLQLTRANAKALGLENSNNTKLDGYVLMSDLSQQDKYTWDFNWDRDADFGEGNLDFFAVALHELGHLLGFVSGVDDSKWQETVIKRQDKLEEELAKADSDPSKAYFKDDAMKYANPLDLFRFSEEGSSEGKQDWSIGNEAYFSIDGGETALASFSTGKSSELGGDGYQASHWKQSDQPVGIMDPLLIAEQRREVTELDITALDVIGWNINPNGFEFDFQAIQKAVEASLADRLGIPAEALYDDTDLVLESLTSDRTKDVYKMIKDSQTYEWGRRRWSRRSSRWQEIVNLFEEEGRFQTLDSIRDTLPQEGAPQLPASAPSVRRQPFFSNRQTANTPGNLSNPQHEEAKPLSYPVGEDESVTFSAPQKSVAIPAPTAPLAFIDSSSDAFRGFITGNLGIQDYESGPALPHLFDPLLPNSLELHPLLVQGSDLLSW